MMSLKKFPHYVFYLLLAVSLLSGSYGWAQQSAIEKPAPLLQLSLPGSGSGLWPAEVFRSELITPELAGSRHLPGVGSGVNSESLIRTDKTPGFMDTVKEKFQKMMSYISPGETPEQVLNPDTRYKRLEEPRVTNEGRNIMPGFASEGMEDSENFKEREAFYRHKASEKEAQGEPELPFDVAGESPEIQALQMHGDDSLGVSSEYKTRQDLEINEATYPAAHINGTLNAVNDNDSPATAGSSSGDNSGEMEPDISSYGSVLWVKKKPPAANVDTVVYNSYTGTWEPAVSEGPHLNANSSDPTADIEEKTGVASSFVRWFVKEEFVGNSFNQTSVKSRRLNIILDNTSSMGTRDTALSRTSPGADDDEVEQLSRFEKAKIELEAALYLYRKIFGEIRIIPLNDISKAVTWDTNLADVDTIMQSLPDLEATEDKKPLISAISSVHESAHRAEHLIIFTDGDPTDDYGLDTGGEALLSLLKKIRSKRGSNLPVSIFFGTNDAAFAGGLKKLAQINNTRVIGSYFDERRKVFDIQGGLFPYYGPTEWLMSSVLDLNKSLLGGFNYHLSSDVLAAHLGRRLPDDEYDRFLFQGRMAQLEQFWREWFGGKGHPLDLMKPELKLGKHTLYRVGKDGRAMNRTYESMIPSFPFHFLQSFAMSFISGYRRMQKLFWQ
ncbi:vWA domain-containing protein [Endozoicomonas euniceicola]|uniref:VWA domain-containing protein n=1 Tax=Endozoicomonas euniceicola TaxID=1234143 RepID=A0ABY6GZ80_9GAMM|nr:vWA domain-containing protein [Endozoicomonas euniceicola]UYM17209.1 VWA domain-containing protein [Endozoicomonas euniceicola]